MTVTAQANLAYGRPFDRLGANGRVRGSPRTDAQHREER